MVMSEDRVPVVKTLATLREIVRARQAERTAAAPGKRPRWPKWRIRVSDELMVQLQPQDTRWVYGQRVFYGEALLGRGLSARDFNVNGDKLGIPRVWFS